MNSAVDRYVTLDTALEKTSNTLNCSTNLSQKNGPLQSNTIINTMYVKTKQEEAALVFKGEVRPLDYKVYCSERHRNMTR